MPNPIEPNNFDSYITETGIDDLIETIGEVDISFAPQEEDFGFLGFVPPLQCSDYVTNFAGHTINFNFTSLTALRDLLAWFMYMWTAYVLFFVIIKKAD